MTEPWAVVIGIGNEFRGDDGFGPTVASEIEKLDLPGVLVILSDGEPTSLLELWADVDLAIVIDAVRGEPSIPGRVRHADIDLLRHFGSASSHTLGLQDALSLGRVLGRLPRRIVVIVVDVATVDPGVGLSEPVAAAVPRAVEAVTARLRATTGLRT
ncbi:hydrogenase maturation protease [Nocardia gamkensis]|uniref:hydrogenase maturation protease n=1 Tax=Nocardia gamkensis TaxID=352869 RepID=UPI0037C9773D